jgi:hypothetical protein
LTVSRSALAVALVLSVALPSTALAGWSGKGGAEPDTSYDAQDGWMFLTPDTSPCTTSGCGENQVYLNAFLATETYNTLNPNLAVAGSAFMFGPEYRFAALFGVWKDCNDDGVIGLGDQGVMEYRSEVLANTFGTSICPVTPTPLNPLTGLPPMNWMPSHNDGTWVREFLPFANDAPLKNGNDPDPWNLNVLGTGTAVWADWGLPVPLNPGNPGCAINPQPVGTYRSTGGALGYVDCFDGYTVTGAIDDVAAADPALAPLSFSDSPTDPYHSHSLLNVANPWGTESDGAAVQAWDCNRPAVVSEPVNLGNNGIVYANVSQPMVPPGTNLGGSPAGTANATGAGFDQCARNTANDGNRHPGDTLAHEPYSLEGSGTRDVQYKQGADANLASSSDDRPAVPISGVLGKSTPCDLGIELTGLECSWVTAGGQGVILDPGDWIGGANWVNGPATGITYASTYASLDPLTIGTYHLSLPKSPFGSQLVSGTYGQWACGSFTTGDHGGWDCDPTHWSGAKVGAAFQLRDIDCYDQSAGVLRANGVGIGAATGGACSTP